MHETKTFNKNFAKIGKEIQTCRSPFPREREA
jgi:hypothetical protein